MGLIFAGVGYAYFAPKAPLTVNPLLNPPAESRAETAPQAKMTEPAPDEAPAVALDGSSRTPTSISLDDNTKYEIRNQMKVALSEIYMAQKSYQAEKEHYTGDLMALQWTPGNPKMKFKIGFVQAYSAAEELGENSRLLDSDSFLNEKTQSGENYEYTETADGIRLADLLKYCQYGCSAEDDHFEAIAAANLDDDPTLEVWLMNDKKEIIQVIDDTKQ